MLVESEVEIVIQVNGKVRDRIKFAVDTSKEDVYAESVKKESIQKFVQGREAVNVIFIPNKLLNIVIK